MFLSEVALGREHHVMADKPNLQKAPPGFDSVIARGHTEPGEPQGSEQAQHRLAERMGRSLNKHPQLTQKTLRRDVPEGSIGVLQRKIELGQGVVYSRPRVHPTPWC